MMSSLDSTLNTIRRAKGDNMHRKVESRGKVQDKHKKSDKHYERFFRVQLVESIKQSGMNRIPRQIPAALCSHSPNL